MADEKSFDLAAWKRAVALSSMSPASALIAIRFADLTTDGRLQSRSRQQIADFLQVKIRPLDKALSRSEERGFLVVERGGGHGYTNTYELKMPPIAESDDALGAQHEQSSMQEAEPTPGDGPSHQSKPISDQEAAFAIAYIASIGKVVNTGGIRGIICRDGQDFDDSAITALQPAVGALLGPDGVQLLQRLPAGYRCALTVLYATALSRASDFAEARRVARELPAHGNSPSN
jgi:hypothetical protein